MAFRELLGGCCKGVSSKRSKATDDGATDEEAEGEEGSDGDGDGVGVGVEAGAADDGASM